MKKLFFSAVVISVFNATAGYAQVENLNNSTTPVQEVEPPVDGYVVKSDMEDRKIIPYATIRQTDAFVSKRIWREIDVREKLNQSFASPKSNLVEILIDAIQAGELTAYDPTPSKEDPNGDSFKTVLAANQVMARFGGDSVLVEEFNENNEVVSSRYEMRDFDPSQVVKFRVKEDWIFDKQRSVFEARIVGIAPLITPQIPGMNSDVGLVPADAGSGAVDPFDPFAIPASNEAIPETSTTADTDVALPEVGGPTAGFSPQIDATPAFWVYFPEARHVLVNKEVMNRHNDATGLSYDDVFIKRMFASYIVKQSNPEDLRIKDYISDDIERLYESERIKKSLMDYEQDLWSY